MRTTCFVRSLVTALVTVLVTVPVTVLVAAGFVTEVADAAGVARARLKPRRQTL